MFKYTFRRILLSVPTLFGVSILTFIIFNVVGGDPAAQMAGRYATAEQIETIRAELGLDQPMPVQYFRFLKSIVTFDFGRSWSTKQKVSQMIFGNSLEASPLLATFSLTLPAYLAAVFLSLIVAVILTHHRGSWMDRSTMIFSLGLISLSGLVYGLGFQYFFAYVWGLFPISGWDVSWTGRWAYLALPMLIFVVLLVGNKILFMRTVLLDEAFQDYARTARAKGLSSLQVLFRHVLPNALIPIITLVAVQLPSVIMGSVLVESFYGIPGIGNLVYQAIRYADFPVIKAITIIGALIYVFFQIISDLLYAVVDPKVQLR